MADISKALGFLGGLRHLRGAPTQHVIHVVRGKIRHAGTGEAFWFRPLTAVLSEVPVDDRELPLLFHARASDFTDLTVQATVTYRITDPAVAAARLDFSVDPETGRWRGTPLDQLASLLAELAQQPAIDLLAGLSLTEALTGAVGRIREAVAAALGGDRRLADTGVTVVSVRVVNVRPEPELERALQTPTREAVQTEADRAGYQRRATAVERERAIAENELQSRIELARREEQLVQQESANARRRAEQKAETARIAVAADADRQRALGQSEADAIRVVGAAKAEAERAHLAAYAELPVATLQALALRELAGNVPEIGQLTVTPDLLTGLLNRLGADQGR